MVVDNIKNWVVSKNIGLGLGLVTLMIMGVWYHQITNRMEVRFYDEALWVGRSYFFQHYITGDFDNPAWKSVLSYDQSKLAELIYGAWNYPKYLIARSKINDKSYDYTRYLIDNGFLMVDLTYSPQYLMYQSKDAIKEAELVEGESGDKKYFEENFGVRSGRMVEVILHSRKVNVLWMVFGLVVVFVMIRSLVGIPYALVITLLYGANNLVIDSGLRSQSEGLFLFLFNLSLYLILKYVQRRKTSLLIIFSVVLGLCVSTKLNGVMLLPILYAVDSAVGFGVKHWGKNLLKWGGIGLGAFLIFVVLNPFTHPQPLGKSFFLFQHRQSIAAYQQTTNPEAALTTIVARASQILNNFFGEKNFEYFNFSYGVENQFGYLRFLVILLFALGLIKNIQAVFRGDQKRRLFVSFFVYVAGFMLIYTALNWERYFVPLVIFVYYFQVEGMRYGADFISKVYRFLKNR